MTSSIRTHKRQPDPDLIERQCAADIVMVARRVTLVRQTLTEAERESYAKRFEALELEMRNAAIAMRKGIAHDHEFVPAHLLPDAKARAHR
jgi:hypothetical protein